MPARNGAVLFMLIIRACRGIITAWYGMNMPNRNIVKIVSAPGNFHLANTNPFIEPSIDDTAAATTARMTERSRAGARASQAATQPAIVGALGSDQAVAAPYSAADLILVTIST